ncbi:hypothetical protein ACUR5C_14785 [Aliikangiella sp. IMCC44653]
MTVDKFLELMKFPAQWISWNMYPEALAEIQLSEYESGHEDSSEHTRFGAFNWWIAYACSFEEMEKLVKLSYLDSDQEMAERARKRMVKSAYFNSKMLTR